MSRAYRNANGDAEKAKVCSVYARKVFDNISNKIAFEDVIKEDMKILSDLLDKQKGKMKSQIERDRVLLKQLEADLRDAKTVQNLYKPLQLKVKDMKHDIRFFLVRYFSVYSKLPVEFSDSTILRGQSHRGQSSSLSPVQVRDDRVE